MPFTFSHPAIVLPLAKVSQTKLSLTGLVIGSLSPDFEYFLHFRMYGKYFHEWWAVWMLCLPISLIIYFFFHRYIKTVVISNLPQYLQYKFADILEFAWKDELKNHTICVIISIAIGAYSHILWDSFTHQNSFFITYFHWENLRLFGVPSYKILQHSSTLLGALVIFVYIIRYQPSRTISAKQPSKLFWLQLICLFVIGMSIRLWINPQMWGLVHFIVNTIAIGFCSLLLLSMIYCYHGTESKSETYLKK